MKRMTLFCQHILASNVDYQILLVSGSPHINSVELPLRMDYIKLPCLTRGLTGKITAKRLRPMTSEIINMRTDMIATAVKNFVPDLLIIDKKPRGVANELDATLHYLKHTNKTCRVVLLLRDILDTPKRTIESWRSEENYIIIEEHFDKIFVAGERDIFDVADEYEFPVSLSNKTEYCGYLRNIEQPRPKAEIIQSLHFDTNLPVVLVTVGGGEDGFHILDRYMDTRDYSADEWQSVLVCGPELPRDQYEILQRRASKIRSVRLLRYVDDMVSLINASDMVVSMAGYNTVSKLISLNKVAVVIPRTEPSREQWLRAKLLAERGFLCMLSPDCSANNLYAAVQQQLTEPKARSSIDFFGEQDPSVRISRMLQSLFADTRRPYTCVA